MTWKRRLFTASGSSLCGISGISTSLTAAAGWMPGQLDNFSRPVVVVQMAPGLTVICFSSKRCCQAVSLQGASQESGLRPLKMDLGGLTDPSGLLMSSSVTRWAASLCRAATQTAATSALDMLPEMVSP